MDFLFWVGAVFLVLALGGYVQDATYRYGPSLSRYFSTLWRRYRLWLLDRRVTALTRRYGYKRAPSFGSLRFTRSRKQQFGQGPPEA